MNKNPADDKSDLPAPEVLKPQDESGKPADEATHATQPRVRPSLKLRHTTYRPSHKATFIGLGVVVVILAINAVVIAFMVRDQTEQITKNTNRNEVTISTDVLDQLGVSRNPVNSSGTELVVGPDSKFNGTVTIGGDASIGGQLNLNGRFAAHDINVTKLQAGETSLNSINVSGDGTLTNLNLRSNLNVAGSTRLQGAVTMNQLLTVYNNVVISGNLSIGGTFSMGAFQTNTLVVGGHIITRGVAPAVSRGSSLGSNGTVSISGNDASGTIAVNIGVGGGSGILAYVTFATPYTDIPHVMVTAVGANAGSVYVNRSSTGFSIGVNGVIPNGSYAFDYIVMQ